MSSAPVRIWPNGVIRQALVGQVLRLVGGGADTTAERRRQDVGLFGPNSAAWRVHGDFTSMMVGGVSALLLQMLHPGALAGVWDHSNFREDMLGRLKGTARFIAGTTYGDTEEAHALIDRVKAIHARVRGRLPDGTDYAAEDPELLTWVHVAEVRAFLAAYLRFVDPGFPPGAQDRYFRETAIIARRLGALDVPESREAVGRYLARVQPQLRYDHRTAEVARALLTQRAPNLAMVPAMALLFDAGKDLLPSWAQQLHGFHASKLRQAATQEGVSALGRALRWALVDSAEARARRHAAALSGAGPMS
jgi:uncharacterized protein (DUF2236 family)